MTTEAYLWIAIACLYLGGIVPTLSTIEAYRVRRTWEDYASASLWPVLVVLTVLTVAYCKIRGRPFGWPPS